MKKCHHLVKTGNADPCDASDIDSHNYYHYLQGGQNIRECHILLGRVVMYCTMYLPINLAASTGDCTLYGDCNCKVCTNYCKTQVSKAQLSQNVSVINKFIPLKSINLKSTLWCKKGRKIQCASICCH